MSIITKRLSHSGCGQQTSFVIPGLVHVISLVHTRGRSLFSRVLHREGEESMQSVAFKRLMPSTLRVTLSLHCLP